MKVLEKGREQKGWSKEVICTGHGNGNGGCGAKLLVEQDDIFETESHSRDETSYYNTFLCPECGRPTDIYDRLPFRVRQPTEDEYPKVYSLVFR